MTSKVNAYIRLMRLHRPVGIWLLYLPACWAFALTDTSLQPYLLFLIGAVAMRSAGCIINDMADRKFDRQVERTRTRPLASGEVSMLEAALLLLLLLGISASLLLWLPIEVFWLALASLPLVALYPFMKRITWWPQAFLGLTFNFGALMGWAAATKTLALEAWLLYAAGFFWTLGYDTIYGHQDKQDDELVGVKSTSRLMGDATLHFVTLCYSATLGLLFLAGLHPLFLLLPAAHLFWQLSRLDIKNPTLCGRLFTSNQYAGAVIWAALLLSSSKFLL